VLRAILLYLSQAMWARNLVMHWGFARRAASRFVAGERLDQAIAAVRTLNEAGINATLDHLGEHVHDAEAARSATRDYLEILDRICAAGVRSNASLKLTQLGLAVDDGLCLDNLRQIVASAASCGIFIRIDMEDAPTVDRTLSIYRTLAQEGRNNLGLVIQAYLYRSQDDVPALVANGTPIRLCKGAYKEPPHVAYPKKSDVDASYDLLARVMIDASLARGATPSSEDGRVPALAAIATHDPRRIEHARSYAAQVGLPKAALEFQMLYGIRTDLQRMLVREGYPVRVYVPYGTEWYPYFVRRLAERPANLWFFLSNLVRR
jgi:proline dehydrogenase